MTTPFVSAFTSSAEGYAGCTAIFDSSPIAQLAGTFEFGIYVLVPDGSRDDDESRQRALDPVIDLFAEDFALQVKGRSPATGEATITIASSDKWRLFEAIDYLREWCGWAVNDDEFHR